MLMALSAMISTSMRFNGCMDDKISRFEIITRAICSIKMLSFGSKCHTKEMKTVECTIFLGQTS